ncbi:MAG: tetratricopeptide repeat protein [Planctomycetota bacterium]
MDLGKHLDKAKDAVKRRNYKMAAQICSQLLAIQPDHAEARSALRDALFKKAQAKAPSKVAALLGGGVHLATMGICRLVGQHGSAARAAERYLSLDPLNEGVNLKLGDSLERAGFRKSALAVFRAFADVQPRSLPACRSAGALLHEAGEINDALEMYERALKIDPRDQESLKARKNLAAEGALQTTGLAEASSSRELIKDVEAQKKLERGSRLQLSKEEIAEELGELEQQLAENPDDLKVLVRVGELRQMDEDLEGALEMFERAGHLDTTRSDLLERAGTLRLRVQQQRVDAAEAAGDTAAAERVRGVLNEMRIAEFRRRVQAHPTDYGLRHELGAALLDSGELDESIGELQQAIKDPRRKTEARILLGRAFRQKGLGDLALGQFETALQEAGDFGRKAREILYEMGCAAEELGRTDVALKHFLRVYEQEISYKDVAQKVEQLKAS